MDKDKINEAKRRFAISRYFIDWEHFEKIKQNKAITNAIDDFIKRYEELENEPKACPKHI